MNVMDVSYQNQIAEAAAIAQSPGDDTSKQAGIVLNVWRLKY